MNSVAVSRHWLLSLLASVALVPGVATAAEDSDPPGRVARLSLIDGEVSFAPAGTDEWAEAVLNRPVTSEDRLWVGADGRAEVQVGSASVHLDRSTQFGFIELDDDVMQMSLVDGAATIRVRRLSERETIKVETPNATVQLRRVGEYHLEVDPESDQTIVKTRNGEAEVVGGSSSYLVRANEQGVFRGLDSLSAQTDRIEPRTPFESWANDRNRRAEESSSARYVSRDVVGYEDLDDHGEWLHEREYGYVWRPTYVVNDWAPYRFGRWAWISPWGWTWIDDARWGYAPFHYGRWVHVRHRWCWVPGPRHLRPVYAPALVAWVGGPSVSVSVSFGSGVGWYPLAPYEVYYPGYRHTPRYIRHVNVSNTIIVNNTYITNVHGRRHHDYRYRRHEHAVTAVHRDHFVSGRRLSEHRVRIGERELREWRDDVRPPAIAPYRESVLAAQPRQVRHESRAGASRRSEDWLMHRGSRPRADFTAERRAIEDNGGRPVSRTQLTAAARSQDGARVRSHQVENPKERGDFRTARSEDRGGKREASQRVERADEGPSVRPERSAPQDRGSQDRGSQDRASPDRASQIRTPQDRGSQYRAPALRAAERAQELARGERETQWRSAPTTGLRAAPQRSDTLPRFEPRESRIERAPVQSFREAPRQAPPPEVRMRSHDAAPRTEMRESRPQIQEARPEPRSSRNEGSSSPRGSSSTRERSGGPREHGSSRTR